MKVYSHAFLIGMYLLISLDIAGQNCDSFSVYQIALKEGNQFRGTILSLTPSRLELQISDTLRQEIAVTAIRKIDVESRKDTIEGKHAVCPQKLVLKNGQSFLGEMQSYANDTILFLTEANKKISSHIALIHWMETTGRLNPVFLNRRKEAGMGHLYLCPTAFGPRKKEWEYHNTLFFYNKVDYGLYDNFSLSLSGSPFFLLVVPAVLSGKFTHRIQENVSVAAGVAGGLLAMYNFPDAGEPAFVWEGVAGAFSALTLGNEDAHISLSAGAFNTADIKWIGAAFYLKVSRSIRIIGEFARYLTEDEAGIIGDIGVGFVNKNGQTVRLGSFVQSDEGGISGFPALSLSWVF